jgi:hypothetical protein
VSARVGAVAQVASVGRRIETAAYRRALEVLPNYCLNRLADCAVLRLYPPSRHVHSLLVCLPNVQTTRVGLTGGSATAPRSHGTSQWEVGMEAPHLLQQTATKLFARLNLHTLPQAVTHPQTPAQDSTAARLCCVPAGFARD